MHRRVLLVTYPFPPVGGAGVQRITKFAKYLPQCGWRASVLTVKNPSVPLYDDSLAADIPAGTIVQRARTWEPGYAVKAAVANGGGGTDGAVRRLAKGAVRRCSNLLLQPDPQVLWMPGAVGEGTRLLRQVPHAAIVASGPPFSTFLIGAALSRRTGLPLVLDYRDEWTLSNAYLENKRLDWLSSYVQSCMQDRVILRAKALVATTQSSARALEAIRVRTRSAARVQCIYNGFDPADFPAGARDEPTGESRFRLVYVGTLWTLTTVAPLVAAVRLLHKRWPDLAGRLELVFAGRGTVAQEELLKDLEELNCRVMRHAYLPHRGAVELMRSADGLCVLLADLPGAGRVVPAKVFEYMAAERPIFAFAPAGELRDLLRAYPAAHCLPTDDPAASAGLLADAIRSHAAGGPNRTPPWDVYRFSRQYQAQQLATLLDLLL
jgi:glycosyltransferase involved in cell wall biosynthesis